MTFFSANSYIRSTFRPASSWRRLEALFSSQIWIGAAMAIITPTLHPIANNATRIVKRCGARATPAATMNTAISMSGIMSVIPVLYSTMSRTSTTPMLAMRVGTVLTDGRGPNGSFVKVGRVNGSFYTDTISDRSLDSGCFFVRLTSGKCENSEKAELRESHVFVSRHLNNVLVSTPISFTHPLGLSLQSIPLVNLEDRPLSPSTAISKHSQPQAPEPEAQLLSKIGSSLRSPMESRFPRSHPSTMPHDRLDREGNSTALPCRCQLSTRSLLFLLDSLGHPGPDFVRGGGFAGSTGFGASYALWKLVMGVQEPPYNLGLVNSQLRSRFPYKGSMALCQVQCRHTHIYILYSVPNWVNVKSHNKSSFDQGLQALGAGSSGNPALGLVS